MNRRQLLTAAAGLGGLRVFPAHAETARYDGPLLFNLSCGGGWDPMFLCDPKGKIGTEDTNRRSTGPSAVNGISIPSMAWTWGTSPADFFTAHGKKLVAINGINFGSAAHEIGTMNGLTGSGQGDIPFFAAIFAAFHIGTLRLPLPYLSNGGHLGEEVTGGLVSVSDHDPGIVKRLTNPRRLDYSDPGSEVYSEATWTRMKAFRERRLAQHAEKSKLSTERRSLERLDVARKSDGFERLSVAQMPATVAGFFPGRTTLADANNDYLLLISLQRAFVALEAFAAGLSVSAHLSVSGFDTHSDHDVLQSAALARMALINDYVFRRSEELGLASRLTTLTTTDFGRGPTYNDTAGTGKAHWPVSSMLVSGPGIEGGRTIGFTSDNFLPRAVEANNPAKADMLGETITPAHVMYELRRHLKMVGGTVDQTFPLYVPKPIRMW
jgi:Protein of unknown function (DUF1501)